MAHAPPGLLVNAAFCAHVHAGPPAVPRGGQAGAAEDQELSSAVRLQPAQLRGTQEAAGEAVDHILNASLRCWCIAEDSRASVATAGATNSSCSSAGGGGGEGGG